nr:5'-3' exonuclease H3TH domain-containing protein [Aquimonas voraii]
MNAAPVLLVDASLYVFRAWHSIPDEFTDVEGRPVNAVQGFLRFLLELLERQKPERIAVAFDESLETSFRNRLYPAYKANREPAPESLRHQFRQCMALCEALGLCTLADQEFEADDLIGSLLAGLHGVGLSGLIVSADKDLSQLLREGDSQWDYARDLRWDASGVRERYGVHATQIPDFLGLAGDAVDNIPGVPGVGAKTAAALLDHFGSLDALLDRLAELPYLRLRGAAAHAQRIAAHRDMALLCRELATIRRDIDVGEAASRCQRQAPDRARLEVLAESLRLGPMTRRRLSAVADAQR